MIKNSGSKSRIKRTAVEQVYNRIRDDILNGKYPLGAHLVRRVIAKRYGVSVMPVMEAFYKLEADGLVENSPQVGTHVIAMNAEDVKGDALLREAIECQVARLFTVNASDHDKKQLMELAHLLDEMTGMGVGTNPEADRLFQKTHSEFHLALAKVSGAKQLYQQMKKIWYRRLIVVGMTSLGIFSKAKDFHGTLMVGLMSGDPDEAERAMRTHVDFLTDKYGDSVDEILRRGKKELMRLMVAGRDAGDDQAATRQEDGPFAEA